MHSSSIQEFARSWAKTSDDSENEIEAVNESAAECDDDCPRKVWVFRLLVFAQFALVATLIFVAGPIHSGWFAWLVSIVGVGFGIWAIFTMGRHIKISPQLGENVPLRKTGPYQIVRHPMYLALLIFCGSYLIESPSLYAVLLWLSLLLVLACKIHYEEQMLRERFSDYESYCKKTRRIIPLFY